MKSKLYIICQVLVIAAVVSTMALAEYWDWNADRIVGDPTVTIVGDLAVTGGLTVSGSSVVDNITVNWDNVLITGGSISGITDLAVADGGTGASTAATARDNLGLGSISVQNANNVTISGGSITGITDLAVADGGTGASTASGARTNLGLGTIATQASDNVSITGGTITGITDLTVADGGTGSSTAADARTAFGLGSGSSTGYAYVLSGTYQFDNAATVRATLGLATTDNVTFNEVTVAQVNTTCNPADNECYVNAANDGPPSAPAAGDCYYDNTSKLWSCYTGSAWVSGAVTPVLDNVSGPSAAQSYGHWNLVNADITVLLPTAVSGMSTCVMDSGTAHDIIVDVQVGDNVVLVGSVGAGGVGITNAAGSSTGDYVCLVALQANKWYVTNKQGTWASQ